MRGGAGPGGASHGRAGYRRHRRRAVARVAPAVQLCRGGRRRARAGRGAQELPAQLRRILRSPPIQRRRLRRRDRDPAVGRTGAVRPRAAVPDGKAAAVPGSRRNLRRRLGAHPAVLVRGAGRGDRAGEPVCLEHRRGQVRIPPSTGGAAVGPLPVGLYVHVGGAR
ncbi:hypothetical protein G6F22_015836 [Rhizopus arrhizus]|nr:hypothetical protein G6F22_015836 [Rhizopus arrhizus]